MHSSPVHVVLVEDDRKIARLTQEYLETHGAKVTWAADGESGLHAALRPDCDVVVLDLMLPKRGGFEVCRAIRERSHVPIIVVTARVELADRVLGLELGADDYVTKPFSARELLARIHALVRRARGQAGPADVLKVGELTIDSAGCRATLSGRELALTSYEFALLRVLAENAGRVLTREQLLERAKGGADEAFDRSIDVRVSRLRHKLGDESRQPRMLKTIRGAGYMLVAEPLREPS